MILELKRIAKKPTYTIGRLYINGKYFCDTIEDKDRGLRKSMSTGEIAKIKIKGETAIPTGMYDVLLNVVSPRFGKQNFYANLCEGTLPRLDKVTGFSGVLIHCGNTSKDTEGCILVGENKEVGKVLNSRAVFTELWNTYLGPAKKRGEKVYIKIN